MAKKSFNLTEQYGKVDQPEEKKAKTSKYSHFIENEILNPTPEPTPTPSTETTTEEKEVAEKSGDKRMNMGFSNANYEFLQNETSRLNINIAHFINTLIRIIEVDDIDAYIQTQAIRLGMGASRRKGNPLQRINLKFTAANDSKVAREAAKHNTTKTQYVNMLIEFYAKQQ